MPVRSPGQRVTRALAARTGRIRPGAVAVLMASYGSPTGQSPSLNPSFSNPSTIPLSISFTGAIVGQYFTCDQSGCSTSFLRTRNGTFITFDAPGTNPFSTPRAVSVNASGIIAGLFADYNYVWHGYLRAPDGTFTIIDAPGQTNTGVSGISSSGEIVGSTDAGAYVRVPDGTFTIFDVPNSVSTSGWGINDKGTVVGQFATPTPSGVWAFHNYLRTADGTITTFDSPGASQFFSAVPGQPGLSINSSNAVVGTYRDANGVFHGYLRPGTDPPPDSAQ